ncbi:MAG: extracellular solute-binding protein [Candidatus Latescibacteria bacterium]|nr:extracellular solute-binding protein [Candidatus Latescibacterota bacterium]
MPIRALLAFSILSLLSFATVARAENDRLVLVSPHWEGIRYEYEQAFKRHYRAQTGRDVDVEWLSIGGTSDILRYLRSEYGKRPDGIGIDVFFGGGIDPYFQLADLKLLHPYRLPDDLLNRVGKEIGGLPLYDPEYRWYGAALSGFGILYNRIVLRLLHLPEPKTWADLGDPRLFSWVGSGDPRGSGAVHMAYEMVLQAYGWEKGWEVLTAMGGNVRNFVSGSGQTPKDVTVGEVAYGMSLDFYAAIQIAEAGADKIGYVMPKGQTSVNPDAIAILKGAPHLSVAEAFVQFVMSEAGQRLLMLRLGAPGGPVRYELRRFCVIPDLYARVAGMSDVTDNPFLWETGLRYDSAKGAKRWNVLNDLIGVLLIDSHAQLSEAWKRQIREGLSPEGGLAAMPVSEAEALALADRWKDVEFRSRTLSAWTVFARKKYGGAQGDGGMGWVDALTLAFSATLMVGMVVYMWKNRRL